MMTARKVLDFYYTTMVQFNEILMHRNNLIYILLFNQVSALSGTRDAAQQRATLGMGLVTGTAVMLLTLIWGTSIIFGSYDFSEAVTIDKSGSQKSTPKGAINTFLLIFM